MCRGIEKSHFFEIYKQTDYTYYFTWVTLLWNKGQ